MEYADGNVKDLQIAYIGGGSRGWAWTFMTDLAMDEELSGTIRLYDIDAEAAKHNEIIGNRLSAREDVVGKWNYTVSDSLQSALTGADFIVISILPGTFDEMAVDVHMPERLGIYQSVGDTAGPGGAMRALRTIPMYVEIAQAIRAYAPKAWVINYTNPMSLCVKTLYYVFPEIKAFGCCHEVFGTQKVLKGILEETMGLKDVKREDIQVNVLGINHFTWFDYASYKGIDLFPIYRKYTEEHKEDGYKEADKNWANSTFECAHIVKFDLFRKYGLIAAAGDRHLVEFMPGVGDSYLKDPETVKRWKFGLTTVDWRKKDLQERLAKMSGGIAVIEVGAATEVEMKDKRLRIEDALNATRAAVEEGIVAGGGTTLLDIQDKLDTIEAEGDVKTGVNLVRHAIEAPVRQIADNAGLEGAIVAEKVKEAGDGIGYNAAEDKYEDMLKSGIVDPAKVTRSALQNAASIAALVLTTEAIVGELPEEKPAMPPMPQGGMGGMM